MGAGGAAPLWRLLAAVRRLLAWSACAQTLGRRESLRQCRAAPSPPPVCAPQQESGRQLAQLRPAVQRVYRLKHVAVQPAPVQVVGQGVQVVRAAAGAGAAESVQVVRAAAGRVQQGTEPYGSIWLTAPAADVASASAGGECGRRHRYLLQHRRRRQRRSCLHVAQPGAPRRRGRPMRDLQILPDPHKSADSRRVPRRQRPRIFSLLRRLLLRAPHLQHSVGQTMQGTSGACGQG